VYDDTFDTTMKVAPGSTQWASDLNDSVANIQKESTQETKKIKILVTDGPKNKELKNSEKDEDEMADVFGDWEEFDKIIDGTVISDAVVFKPKEK
jgi:ssRNA-specific RNase YbeY (16S rRNA maturation enzyme)